MKKENFILLLIGVIGGLLFALGMCMCLLPEWNAFNQGLIVGAAGIIVLLAMVIVRRKMLGLPAISLNPRTVGITALAIAGALVLGVGMCMTMLWDMMVVGVLVGIAGIVLLLFLIPVIRGWK